MSRVAAVVIASVVLLTAAGTAPVAALEVADTQRVVAGDGYGWSAPQDTDGAERAA
ncbi:hypothetical protein ACQEVY_10590 [Streptomyces sp. CA-288835]|uniref:hypothetical protein n=1 Tax=Streptomyces sp. CA-288835 TaxID=3240069 RepID=UPI003D8D9136